MNFSALIKKSFGIAWHNRVLWLFGALSGGVGTVGFPGGGSGSFEVPNLPQGDPSKSIPGSETISQVLGVSDQSIFSFLSPQNLLLIILGIVVLVLVLLVIFIFVTNWASAALVFSILQRNVQRPTFSAGAKAGLKYWWKYYLLTLIFGLFILAFVIMLAAPGVLLFLAGLTPVAIVYTVIAVVMFILAMFVIAPIGSLIISLAQRMLVHKGTGVVESIRLSGGLIKKYLGESLLTYIVAIGLNFAAGFAALVAILPIGLILFVLFMIGMGVGGVWLGLIFVGIAAIPSLLLLIAAGGFWNAFQASYWTLFYEHLAAKEGW